MAARRRVTLISVSGIDGAGKSTLINLLRDRLAEASTRVEVLSFWECVVALPRMREFLSHVVLGGERGIGSPAKPVKRRDKNVRTWYLTTARLCLYLLDAVRLRLVVARVMSGTAQVAIFDRYIYDELANLSPDHWFVRGYVRLLLKLIPQPDIAYLLDADPARARERKPEYPLEFLLGNRASYLALSQRIQGMTVIGPLPAADAGQGVAREVLTMLASRSPQWLPAVRA